MFRAGSLLCALELAHIIETMRPLAVRPLAGTPGFVRGLCVMRGAPTPVLDVADLVGGGTADVSRFIATRSGRGAVALATGAVIGVREINRGSPSADVAIPAADVAIPAARSAALMTAVGSLHGEPLLVLDGAVSEQVWAALAPSGATP